MKLAILQLTHPAAILKGQFGRRQSNLHALRRLRRWLDTGTDGPESADPPTYSGEPWPPIGTICSWLYSLERTSPQGVAVDVEAAGPHIRMVGFARWDESYLPVTIRDVGGAVHYGRADLGHIVRALYWVFANPRIPKIFHNGFSYDIPKQLELAGFHVENYAEDTLLMQRYAYPEAPAELLYCGIHYGKLGAWKHWIRSKPDEENENK